MDASKRKADKLRSWRVTILRRQGQKLGYVQAMDARGAGAEDEAVRRFKLDEHQPRRLIVSARD